MRGNGQQNGPHLAIFVFLTHIWEKILGLLRQVNVRCEALKMAIIEKHKNNKLNRKRQTKRNNTNSLLLLYSRFSAFGIYSLFTWNKTLYMLSSSPLLLKDWQRHLSDMGINTLEQKGIFVFKIIITMLVSSIELQSIN